MLQLSIAATLAFLCVVYSGPAPSTDAETDTFHIVAHQKIEEERNNKDNRVHFLFPQILEYGVRFSKGSFKIQLVKDKSPTNHVQFGHLMATAHNDEYGNHQFAVYRHTDEHHIVTVKCDSSTESCILTGLVHNEGITWRIEPKEGEPDKYLATRTNTDSYKIQDAIREGQLWAFEVAEKLERAHQLAQTNGYSTPRHGLRHKRSVMSTCNIFEAVAVGDASVWQFFLARNGGNAALAEAAMRQHYEELFNEVDLIFSCLPDDLCLRVYLRRVVVQTDASTDWTTDTVANNVDADAGLTSCEALRGEEDGAFCFTRRQLQVGASTDGNGYVFAETTCKSNSDPKSALVEDLGDQLVKIVSLTLILQIDFSLSSCTGNTFTVDDTSFSVPIDPEDFPLLFTFSNCTQDALRLAIEEFNNASSNCLLQGNITDEDLLELATCRALAGQVIPIDHQCELAYGIGSFACQQVNSSTNLCGPGTFCFANGVCDSQQRVYSGTPCGVNKVCFKGECIDEFNCGPLPIVTGGYYVLDTGATTLTATATLICFPGWMISTTITIQCKKDGWSDPAENCTLIECDLPATENGTYVAKNNNKFGTLATLMCDHKFTPSTKYTSIVCQADGNYSTPMATCIDNPCPSASWVRQNHSCFLFNAVNRSYSGARDFCQKFDGAFLAQSDSQEKNDFLKNYAANIATPEPAFGYWIGAVQTSLGASEIWLPSGDALTFNNWNPGQPNDNIGDSGASQQSCTQLRRIFGYAWDDCECDIGIPGEFTVREGFALCEFPIDSDCGLLPIVTGGYYVLDTGSTTLYATATLICFSGWMTSTTIKIQCRKDGWSDPAENCTLIECDLPATENGTYVAKNNNKFGTLATLMCDHKFTPSTKYTSIVCQADGNYSTPMATCIDNPCPSASWVRQNHSCFLFNAVNRSYSGARDFCQKFDGAFLAQSDSQEKNDFLKNYAANIATPEPAFGYWIGAVQTSLGASEIWLPSGDALTFNNWNPGQPNDNIGDSGASQQSCTQLRRIFGYAWDDCECDIGIPGEFTVREGFALCEFPIDSDCGLLPIVTGGYYVLDTGSTTLYATATLICFSGWMTSTTIKIQCRKDGWSDPAENCTLIECDLPATENGTYVAKNNNKFGTLATLMCDHKFTPSTKYTSIVCQADGNYSTPMATCIDNPCPSASWVRQNHSCFLFNAVNRSYSGARDFCQKFDGAFLAQSDSQEKNDFLKNYAANIATPEPAFGYWIGAVQTSLSASEIWLPSGDALTFNNWNPGQPNDNIGDSGASQQSCTQLRRIFGYAWDDCECDIGIPGEFTVREGFALCEFPIDSDCGLLPIVTGGYYVLDTGSTTLYATATLICFSGWMTSTTIKIQCRKDGWSDPAENCTLIECDLPATENGTYVAKNNNKFGTLATLMCDHKFTPSTKYTSIVCQADGNYSTPMATCIDNPCPSASWVRQNHSCFLFNAVNRSYSGARDFCQKFDGAFLAQSDSQEKNDFLKNYAANIATPEPAFGYWIGAVQTSLGASEIWLPSGDALTFNNWNPGQPNDNIGDSGASQQSCTQLRRIFGYAWDDCECDIGIPGEFTVREGFALCEFPIDSDCGLLPIVTGGYYVLDTGSTTLYATATLICFSGWMTSTTIKIQCRKDGWSDPAENCTLIECDLPTAENGTYVAKNNNKFGTLATLMCDHKFSPSTKYTSIVCQADGNYSTPMATCIDNPCPSTSWVRQNHSCFLFNAVNRSYSGARDFCQKFDGAFLAQSDSQETNDFLKNYAANIATPEPAFGYWIGAVQTSLGASEIWLPSGDALTFDNWNPGQPNDNVVDSGASQQSCTQLRRIFGYAWDDCECDIGIPGEFTVREGFALCEFPIDSDCGLLPIVTGGYYVLDTGATTLYATATLICFPGWMISTTIKIQCRKDGWNDPAEICTLIECGDPPMIDNGMFMRSSNTSGSLARLICDHGFAPSTEATVILCQKDGNYSTPMSSCITNCGIPPRTANGYYELDSNSTMAKLLNATATIQCCDDFFVFPHSPTQITCTESGWTDPANCTQCPSSDWITNGTSCYLFDPNARVYSAARTFCESFGGTLAAITNSTENEFLKDYLVNDAPTSTGSNGYWIGLVFATNDNSQPELPDGSTATFFDWGPSQPLAGQSCGALWLDNSFMGQWVDIECTVGNSDSDNRQLAALCEVQLM